MYRRAAPHAEKDGLNGVFGVVGVLSDREGDADEFLPMLLEGVCDSAVLPLHGSMGERTTEDPDAFGAM